MFYFFTCILPQYVADEITNEVWKNSHFESMRADFPLRCQKSLRCNTPKITHFQTWTKSILTIVVPNWLFFSLNVVGNVSRWYFDQCLRQYPIPKPTFAALTQCLIDKLSLFYTEVPFDTSKKTSSNIFKMAIFSKFFNDSMYKIIN